MTSECHIHRLKASPRYHKDETSEQRQPRDIKNTMKVKQPVLPLLRICCGEMIVKLKKVKPTSQNKN